MKINKIQNIVYTAKRDKTTHCDNKKPCPHCETKKDNKFKKPLKVCAAIALALIIAGSIWKNKRGNFSDVLVLKK